MVIDTSAIIAILLAEVDAERYTRAIEAAANSRMSAASYLEAAAVIDNFGDVRRAGIEVVPVNFEQSELARQAFRDFGKGRHPAGLDLGDCLAYALAKFVDEPLLSKSNGFSRTDVRIEPM
jgi:ribonuclease VapC